MTTENLNEYAAEASERWPEKFEESQSKLAKLNDQQKRDLFNLGKEITQEIARLFVAGLEAESSEVQTQIGRHYRWLCQFWIPSAGAYRGMGEMYVADPRFAAYYDKFAEGLAPFMAAGMYYYAARNL
jgi:MerR family transcriptional regulator, thiopeptide resistance regulator